MQPAGTQTIVWEGRDDRGRPLATGVYFARLQAGELQRSHKLLLMK
jgi:hypothetical protein